MAVTRDQLRREPELVFFGLAFTALAVYLGLGAALLVDPSDALTTAFGVTFYITLTLGVSAGLVTIYSS